jgi:uncharacterized protein
MISKFFYLLLLVPLLLFSESMDDLDNAYSKRVAIKMIDLYKNNISSTRGSNCPFHPTCSQYCKAAIDKYGLLKGTLMGFDRLLRCNNDQWIYERVYVDGSYKNYDPI